MSANANARRTRQLERAIRLHMRALASVAQELRTTAAELRAGSIHPAHAANRLDKIAGKARW